ncbi:unnamed protein product [Lota lota]
MLKHRFSPDNGPGAKGPRGRYQVFWHQMLKQQLQGAESHESQRGRREARSPPPAQCITKMDDGASSPLDATKGQREVSAGDNGRLAQGFRLGWGPVPWRTPHSARGLICGPQRASATQSRLDRPPGGHVLFMARRSVHLSRSAATPTSHSAATPTSREAPEHTGMRHRTCDLSAGDDSNAPSVVRFRC